MLDVLLNGFEVGWGDGEGVSRGELPIPNEMLYVRTGKVCVFAYRNCGY